MKIQKKKKKVNIIEKTRDFNKQQKGKERPSD